MIEGVTARTRWRAAARRGRRVKIAHGRAEACPIAVVRPSAMHIPRGLSTGVTTAREVLGKIGDAAGRRSAPDDITDGS